jgi:hypothetical protein
MSLLAESVLYAVPEKRLPLTDILNCPVFFGMKLPSITDPAIYNKSAMFINNVKSAFSSIKYLFRPFLAYKSQFDSLDEYCRVSKYIDSFWDRAETNAYIANSPRINIQFDGGTVRDAVKKVLSSDIVFLIQKNDGKFTLRKWGNTYRRHIVPNWNVTKFPVKDYAEAQSNYFSSCSIAYNNDFKNNAHNSIYLYTLKERKAMKNYSKVVRRTFETYLTNETDCKLLAEQLSDRFTTLHETEKVSIGADTSSINLLDTVELEMKVNERAFSKNNIWIVKEIDPAQDTLSLEAMTI